MPIIFIEGNISGGKTTLLDEINKKMSNIKVIYEPVDTWRQIGLLDEFYKDQKRYGYTFQNIAFITKMMILDNLEDVKNKIYIIERSPFTDANCFGKLCYENGNMNKMEWIAYNMWYQHYISEFENKYKNLIKFVYLKTDPKVCINRIKIRNRNEESNIPLEYLEALNIKHEEWLEDINNKLVLDGNLEKDRVNEHITKIINFLKNDEINL